MATKSDHLLSKADFCARESAATIMRSKTLMGGLLLKADLRSGERSHDHAL
jgi:hypothetical protein